MGLAFATAFLATATTAAAGVFEIEVPADLAREDVLNPTAAGYDNGQRVGVSLF